MWIALVRVRAGTSRVVLRVEHGLHILRLAGVPLAPTGRSDVRAHFRVQKHHARVPTPRSSEPHVLDAGLGSQLALMEHVRAILRRLALTLRSDVADLVRRAVDLATLEDRVGVAE